MDLSQARHILQDQKSSELDRQIAEHELRRFGFFQTLNPNLLPEKMFIEILANPNVIARSSYSFSPLTSDYRRNLFHVVGFDFVIYDGNGISRDYVEDHIPLGSHGIVFHEFDPSPNPNKESTFFFVENYLQYRENRRLSHTRTHIEITEEFRAFARSREFDSGLEIYKRIEKILRSQILMP